MLRLLFLSKNKIKTIRCVIFMSAFFATFSAVRSVLAVYSMAGRFKFRYNGLFLTVFIFFAGFVFASPAYGATQIFRSVGPGATGLLTSDTAHARTITLTSGVATFSVALPDNIGVGDAVIIDTGGTDQTIDASDTLLFIHSRTSSTSYTLRTHTGSVPGDIAINDTYSIYRAYTSLANAEAGTKNTSIPIVFNGGNRDLVTNDEQWNIACYANGTTADTTAVDIFGWTTDIDNFIKIYTPTLSNEVGVSQRHNGGDNSGYKLNGISGVVINMRVGYTVIDGLEIANWSSGDGIAGNYGGDVIGYKTISNMLIHDGGGSGINAGIYFTYSKIYNNLIYNCSGDGINIPGGGEGSFVYNNTVYNSTLRGIYSFAYTTQLKNNIVQDSGVSDFSGNFDGNDDYNISADSTAPGSNSKINTNVSFISNTSGAEDFHLAQTDTAARGAGANLTAEIATSEYLLAMTRDVDGQLRNPAGAGWDIGADEGTKEFVSTVMQTGGNFSTLSSWEDAIDSDLVADTTRVFAHGGITGTIVGGNTVTGLTSGATATVVYATSAQILLHSVSGIFQAGETLEVTAGNSVVISDNGNPASAVAKIDGAWSVADTTAVYIDGWTSGPDNYIKIYTAPDARHNGKWNEGKYRRASYGYRGFGLSESFVIIDGLQLFGTLSGNFYPALISISTNSRNSLIEISNNIFNADYSGLSGYPYNGYGIHQSPYGGYFKGNFYNNIFYNLKSPGGSFPVGLRGASINFYNNTIYNCDYTTQNQVSGILAKNNLISNTPYPFNGFTTGSDYNVTDTNASIGSGTHNSINARIDFVSTTLGAEDFHLASDDTAAKDAGTDLSTYFSTDIDGQTRPAQSVFDIGADEAPTRIYRSVGPSKTDTLDDDAGHTKNVTLTAGVATFSAPLPDNIGVGDVVIIDTAGTADTIDSADTLLFIQKRNSSTSYQLQTHTGAMPASVTSNDTYQIYRAHTSLANAESGTINSTLSGLGFAFNGGNRDLIANNEEWNIACYANGTTADTTAVTVDGWTTGPYNFLKVYTPVSATEVGESQRHGGKWDINKYYMDVNSLGNVLAISDGNLSIEGLQIKHNASGTGYPRSIIINSGESGTTHIAGNLMQADFSGVSFWGYGIFQDSSSSVAKIYNNILYNYDGGLGGESNGITFGRGYSYVYNNTVVRADVAYRTVFGYSPVAVLKNNISQESGSDFSGAFDPSSDNNLASTTTVNFVDRANNDFHLASTDTSAKNMGLNLSADSILPFNTDIDGQSRPTGPDWDIGADEITDAESVRMKGDVRMKGNVRMR